MIGPSQPLSLPRTRPLLTPLPHAPGACVLPPPPFSKIKSKKKRKRKKEGGKNGQVKERVAQPRRMEKKDRKDGERIRKEEETRQGHRRVIGGKKKSEALLDSFMRQLTPLLALPNPTPSLWDSPLCSDLVLFIRPMAWSSAGERLEGWVADDGAHQQHRYPLGYWDGPIDGLIIASACFSTLQKTEGARHRSFVPCVLAFPP